jgi:CubicO group peptidase (beta-lactamase class C family)
MVLKEKIMDPIGASTTWRWFGYPQSFENVDGIMMQSVSGGGHHGAGIFINTYDQARFGLLFARGGKWKATQIISSDWINQARQPSAVNPSYGFMWWTNAQNNLSEGSKAIYSAQGFGGNFIVVDEAHDLVIVTRWLDTSSLKAMVDLVLKAL